MQRITLLTHAPGTVLAYRKDGRPIYPIAGGSGEGDPGGDTPSVGDPKPVEPPKPTESTADWQAEAEKWKALARKHEDQAKANSKAAKDLEELRKQGLSDQERALAEAKEAGRTEASAEWRSSTGRLAVVAAAATAGVVVPAAALDLMDLSGLVGDDRAVDADRVAALIEGFAPAAPPVDERRHVTAGQGPRSTSKDRSTGSVAAGRDLYAERHNKT
ncbi:hypothetical protein [Embleya sp. NPDC001921]